MAQLSLRWRLGILVIVALIGLWLAVIILSYISYGLRIQVSALPDAHRLAATIRLIETSQGAERVDVLAAVEALSFSVRFSDAPAGLDNNEQDLAPADLYSDHRAVFGDRDVRVFQKRAAFFPRYLAHRLNPYVISVKLDSGGWMIVTSWSPYLTDPLGLPLGLSAGLTGVLIALGALIILNREIRPLKQLAAVLNKVDPEGPLVDVPDIKAQSPELKALIAAFQHLQGRLRTLIKARLALIGGIQHDLRTFTTRLRLRVDKIEDDGERARAVHDIDDIIALLNDALLATRTGANELDEELIEFSALVRAEVSDRVQAGANIDLQILEPHLKESVLGDRLALRRMVANLLENALKYGLEANVTLKASGETIELIVDDAGPGIPPEKRAYLFEPFTRLEESRDRKTGGSGLGLAIVGNVVKAHGGTVSVDTSSKGGARFCVRLPKFQVG
ncbi:hypothetical protein GCM10011316_12760 [Roseibium aquae]|uniref:histidine kinase n=1 Tax=Roseibium aquae TaxID=1323746 RepID=A0A916TEV7_9HYPH|nr:ATP-binding protein [Roseibium aquae]GGB42308.1 hypothetical protein GCM10011316_12760 [Roseibium aquae]